MNTSGKCPSVSDIFYEFGFTDVYTPEEKAAAEAQAAMLSRIREQVKGHEVEQVVRDLSDAITRGNVIAQELGFNQGFACAVKLFTSGGAGNEAD